MTRENELRNSFNEAYELSEQRRLTPEERLNFLQNAWLRLFRENLRDMNDDELSKGASVDEYAKLFHSLCASKNLTFVLADRNDLNRRLEIERRAQIGARNPVSNPLQIEPKENRGPSSLGNLKDANVAIQTRFDVLEKIGVDTQANVSEGHKTLRMSQSVNVQNAHCSGQKDVFVGKQIGTNQDVAVKTSQSEQSDMAMKHEAKIQSSIAHQGVPTIISLNESGVPVIVEPYIKGNDWASKIDSQKPEEKMNTLLRVSEIMAYVHKISRIAHGDLKPENVMIDDFGQVYVVDWGYAINLDAPEKERFIQGRTPAYCPPEVNPPEKCKDKPGPGSSASDVYMLGGILCQIVVSSRQTFNEILSDISGRELVYWKTYNKFPEFPGVSKEMSDVLRKALAYKGTNRYQDAGEFLDALKKYQKRRQILRRFDENKERFAQSKTEVEESKLSRKRNKNQKQQAAQITNDLIAEVNEFALIRKELEDGYDEQKNDALKDESFLNALKEEAQSRSFLLDRSIDSQDYGQAQALAKTQADVVAQYQTGSQTPDFCEQIQANLQTQTKRIDRGYARRRRNNILASSAVVLLVIAVLASISAAYQGKEKAEAISQKAVAEEEKAQADMKATEAKNQVLIEQNASKEKARELEAQARRDSNRQLFDIYQRNVQTAQNEKFGQGVISFWAKALNLKDPTTNEPSFPQCYNMLDIASKTSILPQQFSSFNHVVLASGFSGDGRYFIFRDDKNNFTVWDAETLQTVASVNLSFPAETTTYIRPNPGFEDENNANPVLASRFLLVNTGGDVWLVANREREAQLATYFSNIRVAANDARDSEKIDPNVLIMNEDDFRKNLDVAFDELTFTTCYITEKDAEGRALLFVGAKTGEVLTYSLPDFKLVGAFKTQNEIYEISASLQRKDVVISFKDGKTCRRYAFDGTLLNDYVLDFPKADSPGSQHWFKVALSPSGEKLAVGNDQGALRVWNVETDQAIAKTPNAQTEGTFFKGIRGLYWLDEERFLSIAHNNDCRIWNLNEIDSNGVPGNVSIDCGLRDDWAGVRTVTFSPQTQKLALAGVDHKLRFVDVDKEKFVAKTMGITASATSYTSVSDDAYLPEKNGLLISSNSSPFDSIKLIDADTFEEIRSFNPEPDKTPDMNWFDNINLACCFAAPPVGSEFAVAMTSGKIVFFNADDSKPVHTNEDFLLKTDKPMKEAINDVPIIAVDSKAKYLIGKTTSGDEFILWDWTTKEEIRRWKTSEQTKENKSQVEEKVESTSENPEDEITFDEDNPEDEICFDEDEVPSESRLESNPAQDEIEFDANDAPAYLTIGLRFIEDDKVLEITSDGQLKLWNISTGELIRSNVVGDKGRPVSSFGLTHDGKKIALGKRDGSVFIVSTEELTLLRSLESTYAKQSNQNTMIHNVERQKIKQERLDLYNLPILQNSVTGISWSQNDALLCVAYSNGVAVIFDNPFKNWDDMLADNFKHLNVIPDAVVRASFAVNLQCEKNDPTYNPLFVDAVFTKSDDLITLDSDGSIQRWDYTPSKESSTALWDLSVQKADAGNVQRQEWAGISSSLPSKKPFEIYSGTTRKYEACNIGDFQYWTASDGVSGYLTLHTPDGKLSFIDGESYEQVSSVIDERAGFPEKGLERIYVSPDGTKIAGTERLTLKTWILDLSQPDAQWEQIRWRDKTTRSFQLTFSPNSQILASVDDDVLRFWDVKKRQELSQSNGEPFKGMTTSTEGSHEPVNDFGKIEFISDDLMVQTGLANGFYVWNVKERSLFQEILVPMISEIPQISACESLNKGLGKDKPTTFVVVGFDGILRFYQLSEKTRRFEPVYVLSHLQFKVLDDLKTNVSIPNEESYDELSIDKNDYTTLTLTVRSVSLSDDGKTLYVGSIDGLRSYDMEEIWQNIEDLPEKWSNVDVERLTGLRFNSSDELTPFVPNRMIRVDK